MSIRYYKIENYSMKCRLYPNKEQAEMIDKILFGVRLAYNNTLYAMKHDLACTKEVADKKDAEKIVHFPAFNMMMKKEWRQKLIEDDERIAVVPSSAIMSSVYGIFSDMKKAWEKTNKHPIERSDDFVQKTKTGGKKVTRNFPSFYTNKKPRTSYAQQVSLNAIKPTDNDRVFRINLTNVGCVKVRGLNQSLRFDESCEMDFYTYAESHKKKTIGVQISKDNCGDYYIVFKLKDVFKPIKRADAPVETGLDVGIKDVAITSDGTHYGKYETSVDKKHIALVKKRIKTLNKKMSRRQGWANIKFREADIENKTCSKRYERTKKNLARYSRYIERVRRNFNENVTSNIVGKSSFIGIEDLNVKGMMKNHRIARALSNAAMYDVLNKIGYKAERVDVPVVKIGRFYASSKTCNCCGYVKKDMKLSTRKWTCPECGTKHDRDENAAINIRNEAIRIYRNQ